MDLKTIALARVGAVVLSTSAGVLMALMVVQLGTLTFEVLAKRSAGNWAIWVVLLNPDRPMIACSGQARVPPMDVTWWKTWISSVIGARPMARKPGSFLMLVMQSSARIESMVRSMMASACSLYLSLFGSFAKTCFQLEYFMLFCFLLNLGLKIINCGNVIKCSQKLEIKTVFLQLFYLFLLTWTSLVAI